ncbi:MAG: stage 0 sporulation protein [Bacilli bacterium]|nr:stage 0 sporulation protein [Bacilli bacterium]
MEITHYVPIKFTNSSKSYYFGTELGDLKVDDYVVAESVRGMQVGIVTDKPTPIAKYKSSLELKPILRKATKEDLIVHEDNLRKAKESIKIANEEIEQLKLDMHTIEAEYSLDCSKITITYVADERVDFRELLKVLAFKLRCRIELRQIGSRDKARMVGGIGICGLPLCCSTFLNNIEGISINRAKNQMLSLNIPKLSGHCGKLICCLLYEDEAYTELKKDFPRIGETVVKDDIKFKVTSYNVLSRVIKLESEEEDIQFVPLEEVNALLGRGTRKPQPQYNPAANKEQYAKPNRDNNRPQNNNQNKPNNNQNRNNSNRPQQNNSGNQNNGQNRPNNRPNNNNNRSQNNRPNNNNQNRNNRPEQKPVEPKVEQTNTTETTVNNNPNNSNRRHGPNRNFHYHKNNNRR